MCLIITFSPQNFGDTQGTQAECTPPPKRTERGISSSDSEGDSGVATGGRGGGAADAEEDELAGLTKAAANSERTAASVCAGFELYVEK